MQTHQLITTLVKEKDQKALEKSTLKYKNLFFTEIRLSSAILKLDIFSSSF